MTAVDKSAQQTTTQADGNAALATTDMRSAEAKQIIQKHVIAAMGLSMIPVPLLDLVALTGVQLKVVRDLATLYQVPFTRDLGKSLIVSLLGGIMPTSTALALSSLVKTVPGFGTATGIVTVSILGGGATHAIGNIFMQHFETGGNLLNFNPDKMREHFANELKAGQEVAKTLKSNERRG